MTSSPCKNYVFADSQRSRLLFPVVENVLTQLHMQLNCEKRVSDINTRARLPDARPAGRMRPPRLF